MFELVLHNATQHRQESWSGSPLRITNRVLADDQGNTVGLLGESHHRIDFTLRYIAHENCVVVTNRGLSLVLPNGKRLAAGVERTLPLPLNFWVGSTHATVVEAVPNASHDFALIPFPALGDDSSHTRHERSTFSGAPSSHTLAHWFEALRQLQQSPVGTPEFFSGAAFSLFDPGGLDAGLVLLRHDDSWHVAGSHISVPGVPLVYRRDLLARVVAERRTLFHDARLLDAQAPSGTEPFVVAAPLLQPDGNVSGVLYGVRYDHPQNRRRGVRPLEAQFVQAVADTVAARQAALAQETQLAQMRVRLEQAFSPTVARELERNPKLLEGDEREITVLFADLRGSTTLAESLAPRALYQLLGDVLERLTQVVTSFEGTVIDYYGDGLAAFWNAPLPRAGHPLLACQAAHAMQRELHDLSHDWQPLLGRRLHLGIGIHTGLALVGNAGSQRRIKYGPRGSTVHLAARIEGATRHVGVPILLSSATAHAVAGALPTRRVFRDILSGIAEPVDLFEPLYPSEGLPAPDALLSRALEQYEQGDDAAALTTLTALREAHPSDAAVAHLLRRTQSRSASRSS